MQTKEEALIKSAVAKLICITWIIVTILFPTYSKAQSIAFGKYGSFVIKGGVKNGSKNFFEVYVGDYLNQSLIPVPIDGSGKFNKDLKLSGYQNIYLDINNKLIKLTVYQNDTLSLSWDEKNVDSTFKIESPGHTKDQLWASQISFQKRQDLRLRTLRMALNNVAKADPQRGYQLINDAYNEDLGYLLGHKQSQVIFETLALAVYFDYSNMLADHGLLPTYTLQRNAVNVTDQNITDQLEVTKLSETWFEKSPEYRDFLYNYITFCWPLTSFDLKSPVPTNVSVISYYTAKAFLKSAAIQQWFITMSLVNGFKSYDFNDVEKAYQLFYPECSIPYFKAVLSEDYAAAKLLARGHKAPDFKLLNDKKQLISLSGYKGKVVYIDFWGVSCGPCITDIKTFAPGLHEHFKNNDKVVFMNICVDTDSEKVWKSVLAKLGITGENLLARGWNNNPACQLYHVTALPRYVLIDKAGNIAEPNADSPGMPDIIAKLEELSAK